MHDDRRPFGLLISALAAAVLAVSVFLPWYGVSITRAGAAAAQQELVAVARQYGNTTFQDRASTIGQELGSLEGRQLATVSAHQSLKHVSMILLVLAGVALLASLLRLADARGMFAARGSQIALLGALATGAVAFRIISLPGVPVDFIALSRDWGIWLALVSALAIFVGGWNTGSAPAMRAPKPKVGPGAPTAQYPKY